MRGDTYVPLFCIRRQSDPCDEDHFSQQRNSDFDGLERCQSPVGTVDVILRYDVKAVLFFFSVFKERFEVCALLL